MYDATMINWNKREKNRETERLHYNPKTHFYDESPLALPLEEHLVPSDHMYKLEIGTVWSYPEISLILGLLSSSVNHNHLIYPIIFE